MKRRSPAIWLRFAIGMGVYAVFVILQSVFLEDSGLPLYILIPLALVPLVPAVWGMFGWLNAVRTFDELHQRIQTEAGLFSLSMVAISTFGYGFLEAYAGFPRLSMFWIWPLIAISYMGGMARAQWRYK